jgi:hypothetical protein
MFPLLMKTQENIKNTSLLKIKETILQRALHQLFSSGIGELETVSGRRVQILSAGELNLHEGPDFKNSSIILDGCFITGDIEFHKKTSNWLEHGHDNDYYKNVILHVVLQNDNQIFGRQRETLIIDSKQLSEYLPKRENSMPGTKSISTNNINHNYLEEKFDTSSMVDLQDWALSRIMRKAAEAAELLTTYNKIETLNVLIQRHLSSYFSKRTRHIYNQSIKERMTNDIAGSCYTQIIDRVCVESQPINLPELNLLLKKKIATEGDGLRREIFINCVLPLLIALTGRYERLNIISIFWSMPSSNYYGSLGRRFPKIPQNYVWEQQGMLEYLRNLS